VLRERLIEHFGGALEEAELVVPWDRQKLVHAIHERTTVLAEDHDEAGTRLRVRAPATVIADLTASLTA
jgi:50S ribosomal subunit-associated GTPase HflX